MGLVRIAVAQRQSIEPVRMAAGWGRGCCEGDDDQLIAVSRAARHVPASSRQLAQVGPNT